MFTKANFSIFVIWLFHISGIIGIHMGYTEFFLSKSWFTLCLSAFLLLINSQIQRQPWLLLLVGGIGFASEVVGTSTGAVFGDYAYGENLGYKLWNVPLVIAVNWFMLGILAFVVASKITSNKIVTIVLSALIMVLIDLIIEPVAPKFDYWEFAGGMPGLHNYVGWFIVALPVQWIIYECKVTVQNSVAWNLLAAQLLFFAAFLGTAQVV